MGLLLLAKSEQCSLAVLAAQCKQLRRQRGLAWHTFYRC